MKSSRFDLMSTVVFENPGCNPQSLHTLTLTPQEALRREGVGTPPHYCYAQVPETFPLARLVQIGVQASSPEDQFVRRQGTSKSPSGGGVRSLGEPQHDDARAPDLISLQKRRPQLIQVGYVVRNLRLPVHTGHP